MEAPLPFFVVVALQVGVGLAIAWALGPGRVRRWLLPLFALSAPLVAFVAAAQPPWPRMVLAMWGLLAAARALDLHRHGFERVWYRRAWAVLSPLETWRTVRGRPAVAWGAWLRAVLLGGIAIAAGVALARLPFPEGGWALSVLARWALGALLTYAAVDAVLALFTAVHAAIGLHLPVLHDAPAMSRSLGEFWGRRWNRTVHGLLRRNFFLPLARRGHPALGVAAAFAVSALLHFWIVFVPLNVWLALPMLLFFLLQAGLVLLEGRLAVGRWPTPCGRLYAWAAVLVPAPLFVEPALRVLTL